MRRAACLAALALVAGLASLAAPVEDARACTCVAPDPARDLARAHAAFVGTLLRTRIERPGGDVFSSMDPAFHTFGVERVVKGELPPQIVVESAAEGASCGLEVEPGSRVGLYLDREGSSWKSNLCSQVKPAELLAAGGSGGRVLPGEDDGSQLWRWLALAAGVATAGVAVAFVLRARRRAG